MGRPGGGILARRGHASLQGSTDIPTLFDLLPGYPAMPFAWGNEDLDSYVAAESPQKAFTRTCGPTLATEQNGTEVFFLLPAAHTEKSGSFTNTQRLLQWRDQAVEPAGDARSDLWFTYHLGRRIREKLAADGSTTCGPVASAGAGHPEAVTPRREGTLGAGGIWLPGGPRGLQTTGRRVASPAGSIPVRLRARISARGTAGTAAHRRSPDPRDQRNGHSSAHADVFEIMS